MEGFAEWDVEVAPEVRLHGRSGGDGPAVVLLHGHPRAHTTWHRVAPALAQRGLTVVCPDLRGYGRSSKPTPDENHERVTALAVLDGLPHLEQAERVDATFATQWWHWFFFAGSPHAERVITADADAWYGMDAAKRTAMGEENFDYVRAALHDPLTVRAMLEDYRAGLGIDLEHDRQDRAQGRRITCPTLVAWSVKDDMEDLHGDLVPLWEPWVSGPISRARIGSGHHMAEENPEQLAQVLGDFLLPDLR